MKLGGFLSLFPAVNEQTNGNGSVGLRRGRYHYLLGILDLSFLSSAAKRQPKTSPSLNQFLPFYSKQGYIRPVFLSTPFPSLSLSLQLEMYIPSMTTGHWSILWCSPLRKSWCSNTNSSLEDRGRKVGGREMNPDMIDWVVRGRPVAKDLVTLVE